MVKVTIVVPVYNVKKYIRQCLDSILNQTLREIEVVCVDDGSTDGSELILDEYALIDNRVKVIHKKNTGYGNTMNVGLENANGEYIGIVESDDFVEPDMFETLYNIARDEELDVVKSGFYLYYTSTDTNILLEIATDYTDHKTIYPSHDFKSDIEMVEFYNLRPAIWSALYRNKFIRDNHISFLESPGASYQDTSFNLKVLAQAKRLQYIKGGFLHYRQDNINSSVNSQGKVFCVCDEYKEFERYIEEYPDIPQRVINVMWRQKYETYMWNYSRLDSRFKLQFLMRFVDEFKYGFSNNLVRESFFTKEAWEKLNYIISDTGAFYNEDILPEFRGLIESEWEQKYIHITKSLTYRVGYCITIIPRLIRRFIKCLTKHGIKYTFTTSLKEFMNKRLIA